MGPVPRICKGCLDKETFDYGDIPDNFKKNGKSIFLNNNNLTRNSVLRLVALKKHFLNCLMSECDCVIRSPIPGIDLAHRSQK